MILWYRSDGIIRYNAEVLKRINLQSFKNKPDDLVVPPEIAFDANISGVSPAPGAVAFGAGRLEPPERRSTATPRMDFPRSGGSTPFGGRDSPFNATTPFSTGSTPRGATPKLGFTGSERSFPGSERSFPGDRDFGLERSNSTGQWERGLDARPSGFGRSNSRGDFGRDR